METDLTGEDDAVLEAALLDYSRHTAKPLTQVTVTNKPSPTTGSWQSCLRCDGALRLGLRVRRRLTELA